MSLDTSSRVQPRRLDRAAMDLGFTHFPMVPCSEITQIFDCATTPGVILAAREEEAVAISCGLSIQGQSPLTLMQSSGLANSLNGLGSLAVAYRIPLVGLVSMRGDPADRNRTQRHVYQALPDALEALGCRTIRLTHHEHMTETLRAARAAAIDESRPVWILADNSPDHA